MQEMSAFGSNPFTLAQLHTRLIKERGKLKNTPIHAFISDETRPSITIMPLQSTINNAAHSSQSSDTPDSSLRPHSIFSEGGSTQTTDLTSQSTSSLLTEPRVLLVVSLTETESSPDVEAWVKWLTSDAPADIRNIDVRIEAAFASHSTLMLVSVPVVVWNLLPETSAYRFVDYIKSRNILTDVDPTVKELEPAEVIYQRILKGSKRTREAELTSTLDVINNLGNVYYDQGRPEAAEYMYQQALKGYTRIRGSGHVLTADTVYNLGRLYHHQGKLEAAEEMYVRALRNYHEIWGPDHTSSLEVMNNLGRIYHHQNEFKDAEKMYRQALKRYEKVLGPDHPSTLDTIHNLGHLHADQGQLDIAESMYLRALKGYDKIKGPEHISTQDIMNSIRHLYIEQAKIEAPMVQHQQT